MDPAAERRLLLTHRHFFGRAAGGGLGVAALASLLARDLGAATATTTGGLPGLPHFTPRARRVFSLSQSGAPPQTALFAPKPALDARRGPDPPASIRNGQRLTGMTATQASFP